MNDRFETADVIELDFVLFDLSIPGDSELTFRLKTCTVPLSLDTASH